MRHRSSHPLSYQQFTASSRSASVATRVIGWGRGATGQSQPRRPYETLWCEEASESVAAAVLRHETEDDDPIDRRMRLEAVLLVAKTPMTTRKLAQLAHLADGTEARTLVRQLNQVYENLGRAIRIESVAGGLRMMTRPAYAPWLARLGHLPAAVRLSSPMMETLAVVAYRGPVSRADVEAVRGVACGELLRQLMERDLIRIAGRSEELGRPYLYDTTKHFLKLFGLASSDALPPIEWEPLDEDEPEQEEFEDEDFQDNEINLDDDEIDDDLVDDQITDPEHST